MHDRNLKAAVRSALAGALVCATLGAAHPAAGSPTVNPTPRAAPASPVATASPVSTPTPAGTPVPTPAIAGAYPETLQGGQSALDAGDAASAAWIFNRVARAGGRDAQSALYWQAFAEHRAGRYNDALETLHRFEKSYPDSRWSDEAKALQVAAMRAAGKPVDATESADEQLKLYALDGLMQMDPHKALPILKRFLAGKASPQLKERALFIASQTELPEANALVLTAARDGANPELQRRAIQIIGQTEEHELLKELRGIYRATSDARVKQAVLEAYMIAEDEALLLDVARSDPDPRSRGMAAELLGAMGATDALSTLYKQEKDPDVRQRLINGMMMAGETEALLDVARNDTNARARRGAIQMLATMDDDVPDEVFEQLYREAKDPGDRDAVIDAMMVRESAAPLVKMFRAETDPVRKRRMLQALSMMDAPEAEKLVLEILEK